VRPGHSFELRQIEAANPLVIESPPGILLLALEAQGYGMQHKTVPVADGINEAVLLLERLCCIAIVLPSGVAPDLDWLNGVAILSGGEKMSILGAEVEMIMGEPGKSRGRLYFRAKGPCLVEFPHHDLLGSISPISLVPKPGETLSIEL